MEESQLLSIHKKEKKMTRSKYLSVVICISVLAVLVLHGMAKNVWAQGEERKTAVEGKSGETSTKEKLSDEKKEFKRKAKARLDELDKKIDELEADLKKIGSKAKVEAKEGLKDLKEKRSALKKEIKKLEAKSKTKWEKVKQKIQAAEDEIEEAYNKVRSHIKSE
jgi:DNA repair exonuclease SbcCD ATPase subunit